MLSAAHSLLRPHRELLHKSLEQIRITLTNYHPRSPLSRDCSLLLPLNDNIQWIQFYNLRLTGGLIYHRICEHILLIPEWLGIDHP